MERTKYWNNTKPSETQLDNTENSKINHMLYRFRSGCQFGIKSGFRVTVNGGDNTKIDVGPGTGYTGGYYSANNYAGSPNSGEHISTDSTSASGTPGYTPAATGVALADYTNGVRNYVSLVYSEVDSAPLPERFYPGTLRNTIYTEAFSAEVVTEATWQTYSADDIEQRVLVGIVTAKGAGVALSSSDIEQFIQPKTHPACSNPSSITGVITERIADTTPIGTATLRFEQATKKLYWTAPGDAEGSGTTITSSGSFIIYSSTTTYWLIVSVTYGSLPAADVTENLTITALYGRNIPMFCAIDQAHRDMVGTGKVSSTNPHGLSEDDITGGTTDHADLFHVNGINKNANANTLLIYTGAGDTVRITNIGGFENSFLIDGHVYDLISGYGAGSDAVIYMDVTPALDSGDYLIYLDGTSAAQRVKIAEYDAAGGETGPLDPLTNIEIRDMSNTTAGTCTLEWDSGAKTLTYTAQGDGAGTPVYIGNENFSDTDPYGFYKIYSGNLANWIIVYIDGDLGIAPPAVQTVSFDTDMTITNHSEELILKLGLVDWNNQTDNITNVRDIRQWETQDMRPEFLEEHDTNGKHTKPILNTFRVVCDSYAIYASVAGNYGIGASAANTAVMGRVDTDIGVYGMAGVSLGVWGYAVGNTGVYGLADTQIGVYGSAPNIGVSGLANTDYGVKGSAKRDMGVWGQAVRSIGVYGNAGANIGVEGYAATNTGVFGSAVETYGIAGVAGSKIGAYGEAPNTAIYGTAATNTAIYGLAAGDGMGGGGLYGVYGKASSGIGVCGSGLVTGVHGLAANYVGVIGEASETGVYGTATHIGGYFTCKSAAQSVALSAKCRHANGYPLDIFAGGYVGTYSCPIVDAGGAYTAVLDFNEISGISVKINNTDYYLLVGRFYAP